jgi:zinc protease
MRTPESFGLRVSRLAAFAVLVAMAAAAFAQAPAQKPVTKSSGAALPQNVKQIPIPPLPAFHPQEPKRIELANGMVIFLQVDHELPLISGSATIRGGSISEPADKAGLVDMYGDVWRTGGTKTRTGDQIDDYLAARAAHIETGGGSESTSISFNCLKNTFDDVWPLFLEFLRQPAFREDKLKLAKVQMNTAIARRNDDEGSIAGREALRLAYGKDNPFARIPEYATVAAVKRDDLVKWHDTYVHPNNIILGIVGDFDPAAMEQRLRQAFESWPKAPVPPKPEVKFTPAKPGVYFVEKEDVNQSAIRMVTLGIERNNPDYFAVEVMNDVLGGGFSSRLFKTIRTQLGLAYSVGGGIGAGFDHPGVFRIAMGTKSDSTVDAIKALYDQLGKMTTQPATAAEVKDARDAILNRFIFNFDSKSKVLGERILYEFYGYPADFLEQYRAGVERTTPADVDRVAKKYIHPQQFAVLVVGNDKEFVKPLASLGPVTPIDITIPGPNAQASARPAGKPAQSDPQAKALVQEFVDSIGGAAKAESVKAIQISSTTTQLMAQGSMALEVTRTIVFPDKMRAVAKAADMPGEMVMVISPQASFLSMPGAGQQDMPASRKTDQLNTIKRDPLFVAQHVNDPAYTFATAPPVKIGDVEAPGVEIAGGGVSMRWYFDPQSGRLLRSTYEAVGNAGPTERTVEYSDWRPVDGLTLPFKRNVSDGGQPVATDETRGVQLNPPVDTKMFEKAAEAKPAS